jgi:hypothetical protein
MYVAYLIGFSLILASKGLYVLAGQAIAVAFVIVVVAAYAFRILTARQGVV